jgi:uncharacterized membrane protein YqhA
MKFENLIGSLLITSIFVAVIGIVILSLTVFAYGIIEIMSLINLILTELPASDKVVEKSLKATDLILIGVIFFIIGIGLFELFIRPIKTLPDWLKIKNIDQLKSMLVKVIVIVIGVSFTGRVVTWNGSVDILGYGVGVAAVIVALSYFLSVKMQKEKIENS